MGDNNEAGNGASLDRSLWTARGEVGMFFSMDEERSRIAASHCVEIDESAKTGSTFFCNVKIYFFYQVKNRLFT